MADAIRELMNNKGKLKQISDKVFDNADTDKSGSLSKKEFFVLIKEFASLLEIETPTDEDVEELVKELDTNNDGMFSKVEFFEFLKMFLQALLDGYDAAQ